MSLDLTQRAAFGDAASLDAQLSDLARGVVGSEILKIAAQIRALKAKGADVCNLTVGDFDPTQFPIPDRLLENVRSALGAGHTNYPPSDGVPPLREAVARYYERELGLKYPVDSVLIAAGARPLLYGSFRTLLDPGDVVIYPVPSWNNNHYTWLVQARAIEIEVSADDNFFPTADQLRAHVQEARLIVINSPSNPSGTVIEPSRLAEIARLVVEENQRRLATGGKKALFLLYDQVYWPLTFGDAVHATPVALVPEVAPYCVMLDAASKAFCATGLRVGWAVMPPAVRQRMADILGHVGAWAPKAEQVAMAAWLDDVDGIAAYRATLTAGLEQRLGKLADGFNAMKAEGWPVQALRPQGAIYLSVRVDLPGKTNEQIRLMLLEGAGLAVVPFQAFGLRRDTGWFRLSVGAVSVDEINRVLPKLRSAIPKSGV